jgi:hypothetical protein
MPPSRLQTPARDDVNYSDIRGEAYRTVKSYQEHHGYDAGPFGAGGDRRGYVTKELYRTFYGDAAASIAAWLDTNAAEADGSGKRPGLVSARQRIGQSPPPAAVVYTQRQPFQLSRKSTRRRVTTSGCSSCGRWPQCAIAWVTRLLAISPQTFGMSNILPTA